MSNASHSTAHLVHMANDIGDFFRAQPRQDAVQGIANHIRSFWSPSMRAKLTAQLDQGVEGLHELPLAALRLLERHAEFKPNQPAGGDAG
jgi:formate dehydrogenase subunit delta